MRIADFIHFLAGSLATMMLADFCIDGSTKIEALKCGDDFRHYPTAQEGAVLWTKRNLALDIKAEAGLAVAKDLNAHADVLVETLSSCVMERFNLDLDYETCAQLNPRTPAGISGAVAERATT